jgi:dehydrogenase/reductase SDR family protein 1
VYAAPLMVAAGRGLIVNISSRGGREYVFSASYGVGKAGVDRMARDMAHELRPYGVAAVSLSPSKVKTEFVLDQVARGMMQLDPATAQSVMLSGRCIAALARAPDLMARSGSILTVSEVAQAYGVKDPDRE